MGGKYACVDAWFHVPARVESSLCAGPVASLRECGLNVCPVGDGSVAGPGIVFFDVADEELADTLTDLGRRGAERVLAIALGDTALDLAGVWRLLHAGASDVVSWRHSSNPVVEVADRVRRWRMVDELVAGPLVRDNLIGQSPVWRAVLREMVEIAAFTNISVLLTGESGTGKELVARLIHTLDRRADKRELVIMDCTTVAPTPGISGSEFFGHERGAFTGAVSTREGAFALADGGTLFLDEVGELPLPLQAELLRVVQEGMYKRIGGNTWRHTAFRLVCATNRNLLDEQAKGTFRRDFYHRIAAWQCRLPALRERPADILPLARHFLREILDGRAVADFDPPVRDFLVRRDYPGNVRDLRQLVSRLAHRHVGPGPITVGDIPPDERPNGLDPGPAGCWPDAALEESLHRALSLGVDLKEIGRATREAVIRIALSAESGSLQRAAKRLGVTDRALQLRRAARDGTTRGPVC